MVKLPPALGVPVIAPVEPFRVRPAGRFPADTENVNGEVPPFTVMAGLFMAVPTEPVRVAGQVKDGGALMVNGQVLVAAAPLLSLTWIEKLPFPVGVPEIAPLEVFSDRSFFSAPAATEKV